MADPASTPGAIIVDANLLIWAHHERFPQHEQARAWWVGVLGSVPLVGIPWPTILAFLRVSTHPRALSRPLPVATAWEVVRGWLERSNVRCPAPTDRHSQILGELLLSGRAFGNHTSDAHLAALAIEWGLELQSADRDFARYAGLRWRDPLEAVVSS
jgi:toxin-antitoxin system PIN domain toxin